MDIDAHFERGRTHAVCQDYALWGHGSRGAWVLVSDGCSSSAQTDVGARVLAHACAAALRAGRLPGSGVVWRVAAAAARQLELAPNSLDATVVAALALEDRIVALIRGDGIVAARKRDGEVEVTLRRCRDETPDYPSVVVDPQRRAAWLARTQPHAWIVRSRVGALDDREDCDATTSARGHAWVGQWSREVYDRLLVSTDGLASLRRAPDREVLDVAWVAARVLDAPSTTGCFVRRRMQRLGRSDGPFGDAAPDDDLAIAALAWDAR